MQEADLVIRQEPYTMRVPRSQRGGEVVEPLVREQWFVRMQPLAEPALEVRLQPLPALQLIAVYQKGLFRRVEAYPSKAPSHPAGSAYQSQTTLRLSPG